MLRALAYDGLLARPLSAVASDETGVTFLCQPRGPALAALARVGAEVEVLGPFGRGFDAAAAGEAPLLVGGGFGVALLAPLSQRLPAAALLAAFRDAAAARAAELVPAAEREIALPPANVLELLATRLPGVSSVFAAGPDGLVRAVGVRLRGGGRALPGRARGAHGLRLRRLLRLRCASRRAARAALRRGAGRGR